VDTTLCFRTHAALLMTLTRSRQPAQTPDIALHVARCSECQALRVYVLEQLLPGVDIPTDSCSVCDADLAAYVDMHLDQSASAAAAAYPHVWWHLWSCTDCAEIFAQTATLAGAERAGILSPLPTAKATLAKRRRVIGRLNVAPQVVARFVQTRALLGIAYGAEEPVVLDEGEDDGYSFQLSVQREPDGTWKVLVSVVPPVFGVAVITIGESTFQVSFDPQGIAQISGVPATLMHDGRSAISVSIEAL